MDTEPEQDRDGRLVHCETAADGDVPAVQVSGFAHARDQSQHGGVQPVEPGGELRMHAVHRECVLGQVVRADREEIDVARQRIGEHGRRGCLDHRAESDREFAPNRRGAGVEFRSDVRNLARVGDHRQQDTALPGRFDPQDRAQLLPQQFRPMQARTDAPQSERGIVLDGHRQIGERLVAAHIESADRERAPVEPPRDLLVHGVLLVLAGRGASIEKQELTTQQAAALSTRVHGTRRLVWSAEVRVDAHPRAVGHPSFLARKGALAFTAGAQGHNAFRGPRLQLGVRRQMQPPRLRIEQHGRAVQDLFDRWTGGDQHRQADRAREDRDVRRRTTASGAKTRDSRGIERRELRRQQVRGQHDRAVGQTRVVGQLEAEAECGEHLRLEVAEVGSTFAEVDIVHGFERSGLRGRGGAPRVTGAVALLDRLPGRRDQHRVVQQQLVGRGEFLPDLVGPEGLLREACAHRAQRVA
jgi:hypothetical protein